MLPYRPDKLGSFFRYDKHTNKLYIHNTYTQSWLCKCEPHILNCVCSTSLWGTMSGLNRMQILNIHSTSTKCPGRTKIYLVFKNKPWTRDGSEKGLQTDGLTDWNDKFGIKIKRITTRMNYIYTVLYGTALNRTVLYTVQCQYGR